MGIMKSKIGKNLIYNISYQMLAFLAPLITTPYVSRVLGPHNIGIYSYNYSIAYYFVIFIMLGLNNYGNRQIAKGKVEGNGNVERIFCEIYSMQISIAIIVIMGYIFYGIFIGKTIIVWLFFPYVLSGMLDINWLFFGLERFDLTVFRNSVIKIFTIILVFVLVKNSDDISIYCLLMAGSYLASQVIMWMFLRKIIKFHWVPFSVFRKHIRPNIILFIPIIAVSLYKIMDKIMLGQMSTLIEVGFYESAEKVIAIPMGIVTAIGTVMLPRISSLVKTDEEAANKFFLPMIGVSMFLVSALCFGMISVSTEFIPVFYGKGYDKCILLYMILLPSTLFLAYSNVVRTQYLIPFEQDWIFIISVIIGAIVNIVINTLLIPRYASVGAAVGTLLAEGSVCVFQIVALFKKLEQRESIKCAITFMMNGIIMYASIRKIYYNNNMITILLKIAIGGIVYIALFLIEYRKNIKVAISK